ncbi:MAG: 50S ribosomal protein L17 [Candidatus Saganbacteria bacterium]|nr:50S ribosomal protein L17 [Candidatus Saganbacteria bacterium]
MRHRLGYRKLNKATDQRMALLRSLTIALIKNGKIKISKRRGQEVRKTVEKIIALSKKGGLSSLRRALSIVPDKTLVTGFFKSAGERFKSHSGGCTRLTLIGKRRGDATDMVLLELL